MDDPNLSSAPQPTPHMGLGESPLDSLEVEDLADVFVCLRGPCQHYVETLEPAAVHNPEEGLMARNRTCLLLKSDLTEGTVLDCNRWEPQNSVAQDYCNRSREEYWKANPQHDPRTADTIRLSQIRRTK